MNNGWIKLHRQMLANGWLREPVLLSFWIYCLLRANHSHGKVMISGTQIDLAPGQFVTGRDAVYRDVGLSEQQYRTCLKRLKMAGNITTTATNRYTLISLVNWDTYQQSTEEVNEQKPLPDNEHPTSTQRAPNDEQEIKNVKNKTSCPKPKKESAPNSPTFDFTTGMFSNLGFYLDRWTGAYPAINIEVEIKKAAAWLVTHPKNRKSNYAKFLNGWMSRAQDRAPRQQQSPAISQPTEVSPIMSSEQSAGIRQVLERRAAHV